MNSPRTVRPSTAGLVAALLVSLVISITTIAQEKPPTIKAQDTALEAITFDRVVLLTLQAIENNYQAKERLLPLVHVDDYYRVILMTAKRLALAETPKKQIVPVVNVPQKQEKKSDKKQEKK